MFILFLCFSQPLADKLIIKETKITNTGFCRQCGSILDRQPRISDEDFAELRREFMNKSVIRDGDIFLQSSPEELSAFQQFLEQHQSRTFTVVFDGLNIASCTGRVKSSQLRSQLVGEFRFLICIVGVYRNFCCIFSGNMIPDIFI